MSYSLSGLVWVVGRTCSDYVNSLIFSSKLSFNGSRTNEQTTTNESEFLFKRPLCWREYLFGFWSLRCRETNDSVVFCVRIVRENTVKSHVRTTATFHWTVSRVLFINAFRRAEKYSVRTVVISYKGEAITGCAGWTGGETEAAYVLGGRVSLAGGKKKEKNFSFYLLRRPTPSSSLRQLGRSAEWSRRPRPVIAPCPCFPLPATPVAPRSASPFNFISFRFRPLAHRRLRSAPLRPAKRRKGEKIRLPSRQITFAPPPSSFIGTVSV